MHLDAAFWSERYKQGLTGWDAGGITTPLKEYFDQLSNKSIKVLIPGAGDAHEAVYLYENEFTNVWVLDISPEPLKSLKMRVPAWPEGRLILGDFFQHEGQYDLIVEQTFFCAIDPSLRKQYAQHMHQLLKPDGKLMGVLFNDPMNADHPPFGGSAEEYRLYFEPYFEFRVFEPCHNSIKPRAGKELFIVLAKK